MLRALALATFLSGIPITSTAQATTVLHIKVVLVDAEGKPRPVPRHALLLSDNPATAPPRLITTGLDGTADVPLKPGNYTVESDKPVVFQSKRYQWTQSLDVPAGREATLELTAANADVDAVAGAAGALEADPATLLSGWQASVVGVWTPTAHVSAFAVDRSGLLVTNQRAVATATTVEVQVTDTLKVPARVIASDAARDVAVLSMDPAAGSTIRPLPLGCGEPSAAAVHTGQDIFTIGAPMSLPKGMTAGAVRHVSAREIGSDLNLASGSTGGPVFAASGTLIGITSIAEEPDEPRALSRVDARVVPIASVCEAVAAAMKTAASAPPPPPSHLPLEPDRPFPIDALKDAGKNRAGSLSPYQIASANFDVNFITPVHTGGAYYQSEQLRKSRGPQRAEPSVVRPLLDFQNWAEYMADYRPLLAIRVTPRMAEGFWTKVARGAAYTQGVALPPMKRMKPGFLRLQAFCGDQEITPVHPFKIEQRLNDDDTIYEGLYLYDPGALNPQCGSVKLVLYSEKEPDKGDPRPVDPKVIDQIWQDFAPYRAAK